jgi:hypothetical protein
MNRPSDQKRGLDLKLLGSARFDRKQGRFVGFEVVAVGTRWGGTQFNFRQNDLAPSPFGAVLSLAGKSRVERVAPEHFQDYGWVPGVRLPRGGQRREMIRNEAIVPQPETRVEPADSTPEDALKTFLLALAVRDGAALKAVALPDAELDTLLQGPPASPDRVLQMKAELEDKPMRRLKEGDPVRMPNGESRVIKAVDVREGRVVLWPAGAALPSRLENVGGHWKVYARPFIAARKRAG